MNAPASRGRIVVVGGGVGGLAAAYRSQQNGFDVTVLDASHRAGGKAFTYRRDGYIFERGASIMPSAYQEMIAIVNEIGMTDQLVQGGSIVGFAKGDQVHYMDSASLYRDAITTKLLGLGSKLSMIKMLIDSLRMSRAISYENLGLAAEFDTESAADYCRRRLNDELREYIVDGTLRGMLGTEAEFQSVVDFFFCFSRLLGTKLYTLKNGIESYPATLSQHVRDLRLNAKVSGVEEHGNKVKVHWTDAQGTSHCDEADGCILAVNARLQAELFPQLDAEDRAFLQSIRYTDAVTVNAALSKPPAGVPAFVIQVPNSVDRGLFAITLEHHKCPWAVPAGKGAMSYYLMSHWSQELMDETDARVVELVTAAGDKVIPGAYKDIQFTEVNRWREVVTYNAPGTYRKLAAFAKRIPKYQRVKLAGDYFSVSNLNTATTAGVRAARELAASLSPSVAVR
jgi:oxygen-dependent protoporphyrinogen oxidase